ncbi:MAG: hypothetical protein HUJ26_18910 [Planctomycetaceae bacterium]|nr:hypothetical protein [Planctomycetaceae bacterium]
MADQKNNSSHNFWDNVDFVLKLLFPIGMLIIGWLVGQIDDLHDTDMNHERRLTIVESAKAEQAEVNKTNEELRALLHKIDTKVTSIQSKLTEQDRQRNQ